MCIYHLPLTEKELKILYGILNKDFSETYRSLSKFKDYYGDKHKDKVRQVEGYLQTVRDIQIKVDDLKKGFS